MVRFALYYDKDMETEYLNEMSGKGYALTGFFMGFYFFDECRPGEYVYQIDITEGLFRVSNDYREFMREMGVEIVSLWGPWVLLRKKAEDGPFELYTDVESNIEHYTRIKKTFKTCAVIESICILVEVIGAIRGSFLGCVFGLILAAILMVIIRQIVQLNGILAELKERIGMDAGNERGIGRMRRTPSRLLPTGLLLIAIAFLLSETGGIWILGISYEMLKRGLQLTAIVLMLAGIVRSCWGGRE